MKRRDFISRSAAAIAATASLGSAGAQNTAPRYIELTEPSSAGAAARIPRVTSAGTRRGEMLYRQLGSTGVEVSAIGMGGAHLGGQGLSQDEATRLIHEGIDRGINFLDNCWDYNDGHSEERMGVALAQGGYRQKAFLMTKIDGRTKEEAARQIDTSLQRLQTEHLDLLQFHEVLRYEDPDRIFHSGGGMEAVLAAKQAGKVRFIGFTGHKDPHVHLYMFEVADQHGFHFDTVQFPNNVMDAHYRSFAQLVVPVALSHKAAVLGMKCFASGAIVQSGLIDPLDCLKYSLNVPVSVQITGINSQMLLDQAFTAVKEFQPMDEKQVAALISKTEKAASTGEFEKFKTTTVFDGTAHHPEWLG
jgi:predicted aldo/keto reductase-like oxidoreductase